MNHATTQGNILWNKDHNLGLNWGPATIQPPLPTKPGLSGNQYNIGSGISQKQMLHIH